MVEQINNVLFTLTILTIFQGDILYKSVYIHYWIGSIYYCDIPLNYYFVDYIATQTLNKLTSDGEMMDYKLYCQQ